MPEDDDNGNEGLSLFQDVTFDKVIYLLPLFGILSIHTKEKRSLLYVI